MPKPDLSRIDEGRNKKLQVPTPQNKVYCGPWLFSNPSPPVSSYPPLRMQFPGLLSELLDLEQSSLEIERELINRSMEMDKLLNSVHSFCTESDPNDTDDLRPVSYTHLTLPTTPYV
eukprot:TRINITY_DN1296_c0_g2_i24.p3 TRINITY_DN1296_c0_g2~~TRINITY_DN1296_c0_g2_i24.p3  ORF type:complete len:117 (+),score=34.58 TRINITY_DN1296_c0_g2_i24:722-1072(+)